MLSCLCNKLMSFTLVQLPVCNKATRHHLSNVFQSTCFSSIWHTLSIPVLSVDSLTLEANTHLDASESQFAFIPAHILKYSSSFHAFKKAIKYHRLPVGSFHRVKSKAAWLTVRFKADSDGRLSRWIQVAFDLKTKFFFSKTNNNLFYFVLRSNSDFIWSSYTSRFAIN